MKEKTSPTERLDIDKEMNFEEFYGHYVKPYLDMDYIFVPEEGYVAWRRGTGENVEVLHIRAFKTGRGLGVLLAQAMIYELKKNPPYYSVFGFGLASNLPPQKVWKKVGFDIEITKAPYKGGPAFLVSQSFEILVKKLEVDGDEEKITALLARAIRPKL